MIITELSGGLGNQMFQYAMGRSLSLNLKTELKLDLNIYTKDKKRRYSLDHFKINATKANLIEIGFRKYNPFRKVIADKKFEFIPEALKLPNNSYVNSYINNYWQSWQSEKYFKWIESTIRKEFVLKGSLPVTSLELTKSIQNNNSVSVHVRRGDYATPKYQAIFKLCPLEYYKNAIEIIKQKMPNPHFFVFSDDMDFSHSLPFPENTTFVGFEFGLEDFEELSVMSMCKHNIIANSSFSWWGAWLNNNPEKIVISPERWFVNPDVNENDLIPGTWIKI